MFSLSESLRNTCVYSVGLRPSILINVCVALCLFIIRFSSFCPHRYRRVHSYRRLYCLYCRFAYRLSSGRSVLWSSSLSSILRSGSVALLLVEYSVVHVLSFVLILIRPCLRPLSVPVSELQFNFKFRFVFKFRFILGFRLSSSINRSWCLC